MAAPGNNLLDAFDRASLGLDWSTWEPAGDVNLAIHGSDLLGGGAANYSGSWYNQVTYDRPCEIWIIAEINAVGGTNYWGIGLDDTPDGDLGNGYVIGNNLGGSFLYRTDNGGDVEIDTYAHALPNNMKVALQLTDTHVKAWFDEGSGFVEQCSVADTNYSANFSPYIDIYDPGADDIRLETLNGREIPLDLQTFVPDSDIATTGWSTTPLWSKVDELVADAVVISAVTTGGTTTLPVFRAAGTKSVGAAVAVTVAAPSGVATGDLEILISSTIAGATISITNNGGSAWTAMTSSPQDVTGGEKLYIWWRIRQAGDGDPQVTASSDHSISARVAYQTGTFDTSDPFENEQASSETTSDTSFSFAAAGSTSDAERLVCCVATSGVDSNTHQVPVMTNANLTSLNSRLTSHQTNTGGGGGFGMTEGRRAAAGAIGTFACTYAGASPKAYIVFAIKPAVTNSSTPVAEVGLANGSGTPSSFANHSILLRARHVGGAGSMSIRAALYQGAAAITSFTASNPLSGSLADYEIAIPSANADDITDYTDLRIKFDGHQTVGVGATVEIDQIRLSAPTGGGPATTPINFNAGLTLTTAVLKKNPRTVVSVLTMTAAMLNPKKATRAFDASLVLAPVALVRKIKPTALAAGLNLSGTVDIILRAFRLQAVGLTLTSAISKKNPRLLAASLVETAAMTRIKSAPRAISANLILTAAVTPIQLRLRALSANLVLTPAMTPLQVNFRVLNASLVLTPAMTRRATYFRLLAASMTLTPTMARVKRAPRTVAATLILTPAMIRRFNLLIQINAVLTAQATVAKKFLRTLAATLTETAAMTQVKLRLQPLSAGLSLVPAMAVLQRRARRLDGTLTLTGAVVRKPKLAQAATLNLTANETHRKTALVTISASTPILGAIVKKVTKRNELTLILTPAMVVEYGPAETFPVNLSASLNLNAGLKLSRPSLGPVRLLAAKFVPRLFSSKSKPTLHDVD